ncbi:MAG TPA: glycosyltransferase family 4 protein, partial [Intrasporangiaceae bacterium]|nr:glycosyltransferase family 4 protein [Intrasporangiaceae bacterium]
ALLACWVLTRVPRRGPRRLLVADVHENYADLLRDRAWAQGFSGRVALGLVRAAARVAGSSDLTLVADDHVEPTRARERIVVRNEPDIGLLGPPSIPGAEPRAVYVGDTRASRGLFEMIEAVGDAPGWTLDIVGELARADRSRLESVLRRADLAGRVRVHGRRPPTESWEIARGAWVGFALLHDTPAFREAIPSKLYEYLALGIVPIVSDLPRQRGLLEEAGAGLVVEGGAPGAGLAAGAAEHLRRIRADPDLLTPHRDAALAWRRERDELGSGYDRAAERIAALLGR